MSFKPLPIGVDDFSKLISSGYYYVDKTLFMKELLDLKGEVNLFTRPRRFGKTLMMSMLQYYFEDTGEQELNEKNGKLFSGLAIMEQGETYISKMTAYPVISISLKSGKQGSFESAYFKICEELSGAYDKHRRI